jgi:hypothetical protein
MTSVGKDRIFVIYMSYGFNGCAIFSSLHNLLLINALHVYLSGLEVQQTYVLKPCRWLITPLVAQGTRLK